jgi:hypothetical protein
MAELLPTEFILNNPNIILDAALDMLLVYTEDGPISKSDFTYQGKGLNSRDLHIIMEKLTKDGYAYMLKEGTFAGFYYISLEGAILIRNGGYQKKHLDTIHTEERLKRGIEEQKGMRYYYG